MKGHSRGGWFCAGHMIVASSGFGHSAGLSGPPDSRLSQGGMTFGVLSSRSCRAVANTGKGWIFEQRLHPMPRQLPQPHQNPEYCRGSQDAIPADFPPAGRAGCWPSWVEFLGNRKRAMAQKVPTATTAIIGVGVEPVASWAAKHWEGQGSPSDNDPILRGASSCRELYENPIKDPSSWLERDPLCLHSPGLWAGFGASLRK